MTCVYLRTVLLCTYTTTTEGTMQKVDSSTCAGCGQPCSWSHGSYWCNECHLAWTDGEE
jgi:hypothetical protein